MQANFSKYQALGNDMVVIDPKTFDFPLTPHTIRRICHRHFGLGSDGICYGPLSESAPFLMRFFNPDGTEAEKSGNGLRIFARYLWDAEYVHKRQFEILIHGDVIRAQVEDEKAHTISMTMGRLSFHSADIPVSGTLREVVDEEMTIGGQEYRVTAASIGNPHCVIFEHEASESAAREFGPAIETAEVFPNRINVQFARIIDHHTIAIEIWERGAGYTLASGTSSCAAAGAAIRTGRCNSPVEVRMAGGNAAVAIDDDWQVTLTGTVSAVAKGDFDPDFVAGFGSE